MLMNETKLDQVKKRGRPFDPAKLGLVVATAKKLFSENGFERTTIDAISEACGVTKKTIYNHFNSKEALFGATVLDKVKEQFQIESANLDALNPINGLTVIATQFLGLIRKDEVLGAHRTMFASATSHMALCKTFYTNAPLTVHEEVARYLARCESLNIHDPHTAADQFLSLFLGLDHIRCLLGFEKPSQPQDQDLIKNNVDFFIRAYTCANHLPPQRR